MKQLIITILLVTSLNVQAQSLCETIKAEIYAKQSQAIKDGKIKESQRTPMQCTAE